MVGVFYRIKNKKSFFGTVFVVHFLVLIVDYTIYGREWNRMKMIVCNVFVNRTLYQTKTSFMIKTILRNKKL